MKYKLRAECRVDVDRLRVPKGGNLVASHFARKVKS